MNVNTNINKLKAVSLRLHKKYMGKIQTVGKMKIGYDDLKIYYTPGVAYPCLEISRKHELSYDYTNRGNSVAIVTNGTRILGLGKIGPEAGMPVMEGKALLMKKFGALDAVPLAISARTENEIVDFVKMIAPSFGIVNIEDIEMPLSLKVVRRLRKEADIPIFYDDSDGTGIVARAALINAAKLVKKDIGKMKIVVNGTGAAGIGIASLLISSGISNIVMCDTAGIIYKGRKENMNEFKAEISEKTNPKLQKGSLEDAVDGADALIGVSTKGAFSKQLIQKMNKDAIVFALANPFPEIGYYEAKEAGAAIVATGRSDFPNQINNFIAFPGALRGLLETRANRINSDILIAASDALADLASEAARGKNKERIIPKFESESAAIKITTAVATAVAKAAIKTGAGGKKVSPGEIEKKIKKLFSDYRKIEESL
ncbi:MAG: NADP-dependent malic enzyme [Candidatus Marsarchaeota archaeon]|nr:NADP-dependent malic enzyme [Candidatus Marsarchaeota archaeon]MCL5106368.1 NADP-dependent malic enzyme [Candidatus Marsarchaeota archaeon]